MSMAPFFIWENRYLSDTRWNKKLFKYDYQMFILTPDERLGFLMTLFFLARHNLVLIKRAKKSFQTNFIN